MTNLDHESYDVFIQALEKPPAEWASFLAASCASPELIERVQSLLDAHVRSEDSSATRALEAVHRLALPGRGQIEEFRIIHLIGRGGMGEVYLADDTVLKRFVALKTVCHAGANEEAIERFRREALAAARLRHESVVDVYRYGEKDGFSYIAMQYVDGRTLRDWLKDQKTAADSRTQDWWRQPAQFVSEVADALDHAHRADVIHRDVKPENILIDTDGKALLADFGVARITTEKTLQSTKSSILGSYAYMSPEQARVAAGEVDHRTDVFALGVVLYETLASQLPFRGTTYDEHRNELLECRPTPLKQVTKALPVELSIICHKAIQKDVVDRYQSAAHMSADLRCLLRGEPILARPLSRARRIRLWITSHQRKAMIAAICLLGVVCVGLAIAYESLWASKMGQVIISEKHRGSTVVVERYADDLSIESTSEIGTAPLSAYLDPGLYRVVISSPGSTLEATSFLTEGYVDFIEVNNPSRASIEEMVVIPQGTYELGDKDSTYSLIARRTRSMPSYRISKTEVSNREYREYLLSTGAEPPYIWPTPYPKDFDLLPVACISWDDANSYCRWRGVRMPTPDEWEVAAQGPQGSRYPWGAEHEGRIDPPEVEDPGFLAYRPFVKRVDSEDDLATPRGVKHMLSNVREYTAGYAFDRGGLIVKGRSWSDPRSEDSSRIKTLSRRNLVAAHRGFRVAASIVTNR